MADIQGIQGSPSPLPHTFQNPEVEKLAKDLGAQIEKFRSLISPDPAQKSYLPPTKENLLELARTICDLDEQSHNAKNLIGRMTKGPLEENLEDAANIVQDILKQPLAIEGAEEGISVIAAASNYQANPSEDSDLGKLSQAFALYPSSTNTLVQELHFLAQDLNKTHH